MAEMNVPDEAWKAADTATEGMEQRSDILAAGVVAASPLIVVDYLERLAADLEAVKQEMRAVDDRSQRSSGLGEGITRIRERITELRGGA